MRLHRDLGVDDINTALSQGQVFSIYQRSKAPDSERAKKRIRSSGVLSLCAQHPHKVHATCSRHFQGLMSS